MDDSTQDEHGMHDTDEQGTTADDHRPARSSSMADEVIDELLPIDFEWRRLVRDYPLPALLLAGVGGYIVGRSQGTALIGVLGSMVSGQVAEGIRDAVGGGG